MDNKKKNNNTNTIQNNDSYYNANRKKLRLQQKIYYQSHRKKLNTLAKNYYQENKEEILEKNKTSVRKKEYDRLYWLRNKSKIQQRKKYLYQQSRLRKKIKKEIRGNNK